MSTSPLPVRQQPRKLRWTRYNAGLRGVGMIADPKACHGERWPTVADLTEAQAKDQLCTLMDEIDRMLTAIDAAHQVAHQARSI